MKHFLLILSVFLITACQSTKNNELGYLVKKDEFRKTARYSIVPQGSLDGTPFFSKSDVYIDIFTDQIDKQLGTTIAIVLHFETWAFVNSGESLIMMVDGERILFNSPAGSNGNRSSLGGVYASLGVFVREEAHYPITVEQIKKLAYATEVKVAIYGSKQSVERHMSSEHIESIRNYYEKFILANSIKTA